MKSIYLFFMLLIGSYSYAQVRGIVYDFNEGKLKGLKQVSVQWLDKSGATVTDSLGNFHFTKDIESKSFLLFSAVGFYPDTIGVDSLTIFPLQVIMYSEKLLQEVVVEHRRQDLFVNRNSVLHVEEFGMGELRKAACCNLSESFETNVSVDVNFTDALSGAKKIQLFGLSGNYTQFQAENIPFLRGLESSFGMQSTPGTWIHSIQITKGTGSVVNGYESMTGMINMEFRKPLEIERFFVNAYLNHFGRAELNVHAGGKVSKRWSQATFGHLASVRNSVDANKDGFWDVPTGNLLALLHRWHYQGEKMEAQLFASAALDNKVGGQTSFESRSATPNQYGIGYRSEQVNLLAKTGFFTKKQYRSIGILYNWKEQKIDAYFGSKVFHGKESRGYVNAIYDDILGNTDHKIRLGISTTYIQFKQQLDTLNDDRIEVIPGAFAEYTFLSTRSTLVIGSRLDYHSIFGEQFTPRIHFKFKLSENLDLRCTSGRGWRIPNYQVDNLSLLASSKNWVPPTKLIPEVAWVSGVSLSTSKLFRSNKITFVADAFYTFFENQLVVDRDQSSGTIIFTNISNRSFSWSVQNELSYAVGKRLTLRLAHRYLDVRSEFNQKMNRQVMIPTHRYFSNLGFKSRNKKWEVDFTCVVYGRSRLPMSKSFSDPYARLNAQVTYTFKKWDFYLGGENLSNYMQPNAIIDASNPFSSTFDATQVWGPVMGAVVYTGLRYSIKQQK